MHIGRNWGKLNALNLGFQAAPELQSISKEWNEQSRV
jgi:hypothetical protein